MKVCYKYEYTTDSVKYSMTSVNLRIGCPGLGDLVLFVELFFNTLKQHLEESEKFLNMIFSLFYILV